MYDVPRCLVGLRPIFVVRMIRKQYYGARALSIMRQHIAAEDA